MQAGAFSLRAALTAPVPTWATGWEQRCFHSSSSELQRAEHEANVNPQDRAPQAAESGEQLWSLAGKAGGLARAVPLAALQDELLVVSMV